MTGQDDRDLSEWIAVAGRTPSAHNTQPWAPRIVAPDTVEVAVVPARTLPAGDPSFRDLVLALGAWCESLSIAAGRAIEVEPLEPLRHLDELPLVGPVGDPVLRVRITDRPGDSAFTPQDVLERRVSRGELAALPWVAPALPPGLGIREIDPGAMARLVRLGVAYTASRPSVAEELLHWLRLSPAHPNYHRDGMTDRMLMMPRPVAAVAAPFTRRARLRDPAIRVGGAFGRMLEGLERTVRLPQATASAGPRHVVLVADARRLGGAEFEEHRVSATEAMDSRIGAPEFAVLDAGRELQRIWLHVHRLGGVVSPHSEIIDSPHAHGRLRRRLGLRRSEVALAVFTVGRAVGDVPISPRLTDARS
ncbi:hypothetical protein HQQ81_01450 [Microbacteriaceae bacterium VKM Ac-2854]|nr:hypothetical protein [Microbacteriaceae bacterium VKM Ac-2854]